MTGEQQHGRVRNALVWSGVGLLAGALLWAAVLVTVADGDVFEGTGGWWMLSCLVAALVLVFGVVERPGTERTRGGYLFGMSWAIGAGLLAAWMAFPRDTFAATTDSRWSFDPSPSAVHLWLVACATVIGCALVLSGSGRADPRPFRWSTLYSGAGVLAVALAGALVAQLVVPWVPHREGGAEGDPAPVPADVSEEGWSWRPPMDTDITGVEAGRHGPIVLLGDGAVALDGTDGTELWSYRRPYDVVTHVWTEDGHVHVRHRPRTEDDTNEDLSMAQFEGGDHFETARLHTETGALVDEVSGAPRPSVARPGEHSEEMVHETLSLPENCVVHRTEGYGHRLAGVVGCVDEEHTESAVASGDPFGFPDSEVEVMVVAVDLEEESELWRTERFDPGENERPRLADAPGAPAVVVGNGPDGRTVVLGADTGEELVALPEELEASEDLIGPAQVDADGAVIAAGTGGRDLQTTFHRVDTSGEITDSAAVEDVYLDAKVGGDRIAVLDEAVVIAEGGDPEHDGHAGLVVAPFGETTSLYDEIVLPGETEHLSGLVKVPGALVVSMEDGESQILRAFVP
ncbi:hypothetical protein [Nocardiopsis salina]|uniref:hypothetical protein n=1 Tax=Nocardiopsis salina TaxID=245836 RepID=UPI00034BA176|nr:hypothetical protein [Nocardiopsis salina]